MITWQPGKPRQTHCEIHSGKPGQPSQPGSFNHPFSLFNVWLKHRASLYLKFEGLNLSVVIIFNTFHWLKNFESCSVVSIALLCVSLLLRQRKVILCCCETTFLIIAELTYNLTYQIIISPNPLIISLTLFTPISLIKIIWTVNSCFIHSICKACDNLRMRGRTSKSARNILNDLRTTTLGNVWASFWHLLETMVAVWFLKTNFHAF